MEWTVSSVLFLHLLLGLTILYQSTILAPYLLRRKRTTEGGHSSDLDALSILSVNVLQSNENYDGLLNLIKHYRPDILLTIESNAKWEKALSVLDSEYSHCKKAAHENTYGMHFYTNLDADSIVVHYPISDQRPAIEAHLRTRNNTPFVFFGIHPPPPSPTEEETSKEKDGELMMLAKSIRKLQSAVLVVGDFNSVCWSRISKLFSKVSGLIDARIGRGLISTFPAQWALLRFPIDLMYHSKEVRIKNIEALKDFGSDHLPLYSTVMINAPKRGEPHVEEETMEEVDTIIEEGQQEAEST